MRKPTLASHMKSTQTEQARPDQVKNNAGGYVFKLDNFKRLERFLILGSDSNTYYQTTRQLTRENAQVVNECFKEDLERTIETIVSVSHEGRAPKNDSAIFALALGTVNDDVKVRQAVYANVFKVCRTGTHIFQFISNCIELGKGWGRGFKNIFSKWYLETPLDNLAFQMAKYPNRHDYNHIRLLQLAKPKGADERRVNLFRHVVGKEHNKNDLPVITRLRHELMQPDAKVIPILRKNKNIPWECIPTSALNDPEVWKLLLPDMGLTAMLRNLGKMSSIDVLRPLSKEEAFVVASFRDEAKVRKARLHPLTILFAKKTYERDMGLRGDNVWTVNREVCYALERAFYLSFGNVEGGTKRTFIGLDVSGSMSSHISNTSLSCAEAAAAMAMVTFRSEPQVVLRGFTAKAPTTYRSHYTGKHDPSGMTDMGITRDDSLADVMKKTSQYNFGRTDCSLPMVHALDRKMEVDQFVIYTDNETWAGRVHPYKALQDYRKAMGINAKLVVVGMTSTGFSIADPSDPGMLDVVGFDTSAPALIANF